MKLVINELLGGLERCQREFRMSETKAPKNKSWNDIMKGTLGSISHVTRYRVSQSVSYI